MKITPPRVRTLPIPVVSDLIDSACTVCATCSDFFSPSGLGAGTEGDPDLPPGFDYGSRDEAAAAAEGNKENGIAEHNGTSASETATASAPSDGSHKATAAASVPAGQDADMLQDKLKGLQVPPRARKDCGALLFADPWHLGPCSVDVLPYPFPQI